MICVLIEFKEIVKTIDDYVYQSTHEINMDELHKISFIECFGNRNQDDILI